MVRSPCCVPSFDLHCEVVSYFNKYERYRLYDRDSDESVDLGTLFLGLCYLALMLQLPYSILVSVRRLSQSWFSIIWTSRVILHARTRK